MVEVVVGPDRICEKEETRKLDTTDLVDDRAVPDLSNPNLIYSTVSHNGK